MAVVDQVKVMSPGMDVIRAALVSAIWAWLNEHATDAVYTVRAFKVFKYTVRIADLFPLFVVILGQPVNRAD